MTPHRVLIVLVVAATAALDGAVLAGIHVDGDGAPSPFLLWIFALALLLSQTGLMAVWLALGKAPGRLRLIGVVVVAGLWIGALAWVPNTQGSAEWAALWVAQTILVVGPLLAARRHGLRLHQVSADAQLEGPTAPTRTWQFSIASLLGWTTAVAVMLSAIRCAGPFDSRSFSVVLEEESLVLLFSCVVLTFSALWAALGTRRWVRALILFGVVGAPIVGGLVVFEDGFLPYTVFLALFLMEAVLLLATLSVFRIAGYRLTWRRDDHGSPHERPAPIAER